jgi:hypothetical protein
MSTVRPVQRLSGSLPAYEVGAPRKLGGRDYDFTIAHRRNSPSAELASARLASGAHLRHTNLVSPADRPRATSYTSDATALRTPAAVFQRVWPRVAIGRMFALELGCGVFLIYLSIKLVRLALPGGASRCHWQWRHV